MLDHENHPCELVEGTLVEKPMGYEESEIAGLSGHVLEHLCTAAQAGIVTGADGTIRLFPGLVRIPDVAFASWGCFPDRKRPKARIPQIAPDLVVEVLSKGNTKPEMAKKLGEYFEAGRAAGLDGGYPEADSASPHGSRPFGFDQGGPGAGRRRRVTRVRAPARRAVRERRALRCINSRSLVENKLTRIGIDDQDGRGSGLGMMANATMVPDYYARLGVDPGADRAEIEAALKRMQPAWSMGTRNPKTRHANQLYLDEIPALRKALLSDPASRAAYDAELAMIQAAERERKLDELQRRVRLRAAKGGLSSVRSRAPGRRGGQAGLERGRPAPHHAADPESGRSRRASTATPSWTRTRPPTSSTRRPAARSAWRSSTWAAATCTTRLGVRATRRPVRHRRPRRRRAPALDEEGPGHRREDRLARGHHARAIAPGLAQDASALRPDPGPARPRNRSRAWPSSLSRG